MKCAIHAEVEAERYCRNCGRPLCAQCKHDVRGVIYCEDCLAATVLAPPSPPPSPPPAVPGAPNPGLAVVLGLIPGVGAIYNGQYLKGVVHVLIFGGIIALLNQGPSDAAAVILGLGLAAFYFYMVVDAYRTAKAKSAGIPVADDWVLGGKATATRFPTGPIVLIGVGVLLLLQTLGVFEHLFSLWPIALILLGVLLLLRRMSPSGQ